MYDHDDVFQNKFSIKWFLSCFTIFFCFSFSEPSPDAENAAASGQNFELNSCNSIDSVQEGQTGSRLCHINSDGTQVIEIHKPQNKAINFFISRGNAQFKHGKYRYIYNDICQNLKKNHHWFFLYKASELWKKKFTSLCLRYKQAFYKLELFIYNVEEENRVNTFVSLK